ncbi:hypothetical protein ABT093_38000 [Kitasatospora sp. NPDC002551]|uniref:hypothetical protein n=1 Tax=Kitasatospora sp. NPDC002551 TaxID=3154539 RepID=UPI0033263AD8
MATTRLTCLDAEAAANVVAEHAPYGGRSNTVVQDGGVVVIDFYDPRWPMDIAEYAFEQGLAHGEDAARVIAAASDAVDAAR